MFSKTAAEQRDQAAEQSEASVSAGITTDALNRSALARREAASDRRRALQDRGAAARERTEAELDRNTSLADRGAGASERTYAERDHNTSLADRGASARERDGQREQSHRLESLAQLPKAVAFPSISTTEYPWPSAAGNIPITSSTPELPSDP